MAGLVFPGAVPSPRYPTDRVFSAAASPRAAGLETRWMAGPMPPALQQGPTPECTSAAAALARSYLARRQPSDPMPVFDFSWLYGRQKLIDGLPGVQGSTLRAALTVMREQGIRTVGNTDEGTWRIADFGPVPLDYAEIRAAIREFGVVLWAGVWKWSWLSPVPPNYEVPAPWEPAADTPPGHAIVFFGYDDRKLAGAPSAGSLAFQSSWGNGYGRQGRGYIPAAYIPLPGESYEAWWMTDLVSTGSWSVAP